VLAKLSWPMTAPELHCEGWYRAGGRRQAAVVTPELRCAKAAIGLAVGHQNNRGQGAGPSGGLLGRKPVRGQSAE
jgi:hypothetical protein